MGSTAVIASGACSVVLGSNTTGFVYVPAEWTRLVGFKPSYGTDSRCGLVAYCYATVPTVEACAVVFRAIAGEDYAGRLFNGRQRPLEADTARLQVTRRTR